MNDRDRLRAERWAEAVRGLDFESGFVVPTRGTYDADLAWEMISSGIEALRENRRTEAVGAYASAVRLAPDIPEAYLGLGQAMLTKGRVDLAVASFRSAKRLDPRRLDARIKLANALAMKMRRAEAIEEMRGALELNPSYGPAHERLAIWHYYAEDYETAWEHVAAARRVQQPLPPQFVDLLEARMPDPAG